jgi:sulfonate transport system substrate-binding protein
MSINFVENQRHDDADPIHPLGTPVPETNPWRSMLAMVLFAILILVIAACGKSSTETSSGKTSSTINSSVPSVIPADITIRVGDQQDFFKTTLALAGEDQAFPYKVEYATFVGGPPMLQAFKADELDLGFVADAPLIFAQAQGQDIKGIAAWANERGNYSLITSPGTTNINGWSDLKGKKVAAQSGTALQGALLTGLNSVGLALKDITLIDVPVIQIPQVLKSGDADAGIGVWPLTGVYFAENPTAKSVADAKSITDRLQFLIASGKALSNDGKTAAVADYLSRLVRATKWGNNNPEVIAQKTLVETYKLTFDAAKTRLTDNGPTSFYQLPGELTGPQQELTDLFYANGLIPMRIDAANQFDPRFNEVVKVAWDS